MKRADLATPKGIDHDYNYLTSIERELDRADKYAASRGLVLEEEERRRSKQPVKGETQFNAALERCGAVVTKAPKGMTRSKQNETVCSKKNRTLHWTVEWVHPDGNRTMDRLWETQRISAAYEDHLRYLDSSRPKKRRKADNKQRDPTTSSSVPVNGPIAGERPSGSTMTTASVSKRKREGEETNTNRNAEGEGPNTAIATNPDAPGAPQHSASIPASSDASPATDPAPSETDLNFFLHHPSLPSKYPVLIPLPPDAKLATSLTNRLVLEFPTIYVLHSQPDGKLPDGFVSEEDFFASAKKELIEEIAAGEPSIGAAGGDSEGTKAQGLEDGEVDEGRLLEVLGKDLEGVAGLL